MERLLPEHLQPASWRRARELDRARQRKHGEKWLRRAQAAADDPKTTFAANHSRAVVVTGSDSTYAGLALELVASMDLHSELRGIPLAVIDCGMEATQADELRAAREGLTVVPFGWPADTKRRRRWPDAARAHLAIERMTELVPGHEIYVWVDADMWFQTPLGLIEAIAIASCCVLAIAPEAVYNPSWEKRYRRFLGRTTTARLAGLPIYNTGLFANHIDSPFWSLWRRRGDASAALARRRLSDQAPLNELLHLYDVPFVELSHANNWAVSVSPPIWSERLGLWLSPQDRTTPLSGMHLTGRAKWEPVMVADEHGAQRELDCTFSGWRRMQAAALRPGEVHV